VDLPDLTYHRHIHLIGIGGAGMGPIAEILSRQGHQVSGSDPSESSMVQHLRSLGIHIYTTHDAQNIIGADIIAISTAISHQNPEVLAAKKTNISVVPRAQMLAAMMLAREGIAVAGTHGKTTTTSLLASLLTEGGLDPTYVIGGLLKSTGSNAGIGKSNLFVAEADESDASFLYLHPQIAIVTNIDADHMETYAGDFQRLRETFVQFLHQLPEDGLAVLCIDDPVIRELIPQIKRPTLTYGFDAAADIRLQDYEPQGFQSQFTLLHTQDNRQLRVTLNTPGQYNALNAAAAYAVAFTLGVSETSAQSAFKKFAGVGRRMQVYGELETAQGKVLLVDDYGHHPREISAAWLGACQAWPSRRLVVAFQPHRYTRTRDLFNDFVDVLSNPNIQLILLDIYSAGEASIAGIDGPTLFKAIKNKNSAAIFVADIQTLPSVLKEVLEKAMYCSPKVRVILGGLPQSLRQKALPWWRLDHDQKRRNHYLARPCWKARDTPHFSRTTWPNCRHHLSPPSTTWGHDEQQGRHYLS
jgi:UDP-N-acetylmuramate--alanine ligase